jgi:uncharacterized protein YkwD
MARLCSTPAEEAVRRVLNAERRTFGVKPALVMTRPLLRSARDWLRVCQEHGDSAHSFPGEVPWPDRLPGFGWRPEGMRWYAQTIWWYSGNVKPEDAVRWWVYVSTAGHREVVLDKRFREVGVAVGMNGTRLQVIANFASERSHRVPKCP